jgi:PKD repeat protein
MRSIRWLAAVTGTLALASGCGGGSGVGPNQSPVAGFSQVCTALSCVFTDASTDPDGAADITGWSWNFGDGATANVQNPPAHGYATAGDKSVTLTVTDAAGLSNTLTKTVTVAAANTPPVASFADPICSAGACSFTSTSTDAEGAIATYAWDFGDPTSANNTANTAAASHTYVVAAVKDFTVTLTVTDAAGASATATKTITISPPAACQSASGANIACGMSVTNRAKVTITLTGISCELRGNQLYVVSPVAQTIFSNGCAQHLNTVYTVNGPNSDGSFNANTLLQVQFTQGAGVVGDPPKQAPAIRLTGSYPDWTLEIDDGGNAGQPRDFNDLVLLVHATAAP